ncbi:Conidiation protein 6-domain-containing protein [Mycena belliarum]|uniref:Conidiation protein 6-domain-containing protein n=1 Tax=Mycena belliarum TaxID=1033014 RepID=A0AAD6UDB2_9AGAR|nr:Conidiation protein 6-domain-containing protein [Mycena belliae]
MTSYSDKDPVRVAAGLKSTLARDNVSSEAKEHAQERLDEMGDHSTNSNNTTSVAHAREILEAAGYSVTDENAGTDEHQTRVLAGYKAALSNPRVSEGAKQHAREYLKEHGGEV